MNEKYFPEVVQALAGEAYKVYVYFSDGSIHLYDMASLIQGGGVFSKLLDRDFFEKALTVMNGTIAWDLGGHYDPTNCIDIDPFDVYDAPSVKDPLEEVA